MVAIAKTIPIGKEKQLEIESAPTLDSLEKATLEQFVPMSYRSASRFSTDLIPYEDLQQIAFLGIAAALRTYNGGSDLAYWLWRKGYHAVEDAIRSEARRVRRNPQASDVEIGSLRSCDRTGEELLIGDDEEREHAEELAGLRENVGKLNEPYLSIVTRIGLNGESQESVAKAFGVSQSWISRYYNEGLELLKKIYFNPESAPPKQFMLFDVWS